MSTVLIAFGIIYILVLLTIYAAVKMVQAAEEEDLFS